MLSGMKYMMETYRSKTAVFFEINKAINVFLSYVFNDSCIDKF
jgi:hypothetical protein